LKDAKPLRASKPSPAKAASLAFTVARDARTALTAGPPSTDQLVALAHTAEESSTVTSQVLQLRVRDQQNETTAGVAAGAPFGVLVVWALNSFVLKSPLSGEIAVTIGTAVTTAAALAYRAIVRRMQS
jgi:hypothetical protein